MQPFGPRSFWMNSPPAVEPLRLRRVPLLAAALAFAVGDLLARQWHGPALLLTATSLLLAFTAVSLWRYPRVAAVPALALWVAVGCWCATVQPPVDQQPALRRFADGLSRTVDGRVTRVRVLRDVPRDARASGEAAPEAPASPAAPWLLEPGAWENDERDARETVDLAVDNVEQLTPDRSWLERTGGGLRITVLGASPIVHCGDRVQVPVRLRLPEVYRDPGVWSYHDQLLNEGMGAIASVKAGRMQVVGHAAAAWSCRANALQGWAAARVAELPRLMAAAGLPSMLRLDPDDAAMVAAMLFGDRARLRPSLRVGFERTGTFHLFVVSGLHISLLAAALFGLLRRVRLPELPAALLTLSLTASYALLTGWGAPVQRALLMTAAFLLGRALGRETTGLNALGLALLLLLAVNPRMLLETGFQMTALVILAVAGLAVPISDRWLRPVALALRHIDLVVLDARQPPRLAELRVRLRMWRALLRDLGGAPLRGIPVSLLRMLLSVAEALVFGAAIELCMLLPMAMYFHRATLLALPVNLLAIPLLAVLLCVALLTFVAALIQLKLALLPGAVLTLCLHGVRFLVSHVSRVSIADLRVPAPPPGALVCAGALLVFSCVALRSRHRAAVAAGLCAALLLPLVVLIPGSPQLYPGRLEVTAIDVGQGDSLLVASPEGRTMLVDAGGPNGLAPSSDRWDVGEEVVAPYLWSRRLRRLDVVLLSHAHSDHMGGMPAVLRDLRPRELWIGPHPTQAPALDALLSEAQRLGITVRSFHAGEHTSLGSVLIDVLAPTADYTNPGEPRNDDSLVIRLRLGAASVLLAGDAEAASESAMLATGTLTPVTLLKVGHHGSRTSTRPDFLQALAPRAALVSVGMHNTFGHPRPEVLRRLEDAHVHTWRTDRQGAHTFLLAADGSYTDQPGGGL